MPEALTEKVSFEFIRYANCWEDADILIQGLNPEPGSKILSIGSAGDNSFSLLVTDPSLVVAVDVNKIQLHLIELKKAAIQHLTYNELLSFLGFRVSDERKKIFNSIKSSLSDPVRLYWEHNITQIEQGIINQGKFEHYFQLFSTKILPWIHSRSTTAKLFISKTEAGQQEFYDKHWNTWRWRLLFKIFFSKYVMGKYGRDPEFLKEVKVAVGTHIFNKAELQLRSAQAQHNFILRYNLTGSFEHLLPHYLQPGNYEVIRIRLDKLKIKEGYAQDAVQEYGNFRYMNLSNIFEYMNPELFRTTAEQLVISTESGGRLAYWNLMVPRRISLLLPKHAVYEQEVSEQLTKADKGFFYNQFIVDRKR
ncbi:MAG: DUF3419 family protein [Bacteroidia bacterium]